MPEGQRRAEPSAVRPCVHTVLSGPVRGGRTARFATGSPLSRLLVVGGLITVAWLLGLIYGVFGSAASVAVMPAQSSAHDVVGPVLSGVLPSAESPGSVMPSGPLALSTGGKAEAGPWSSGGFPTATNGASANAEAMAGRTI